MVAEVVKNLWDGANVPEARHRRQRHVEAHAPQRLVQRPSVVHSRITRFITGVCSSRRERGEILSVCLWAAGLQHVAVSV